MALDGTDVTDPSSGTDQRIADLEAWVEQLQDQQNRIVAILQATAGALAAVAPSAVADYGLPPT